MKWNLMLESWSLRDKVANFFVDPVKSLKVATLKPSILLSSILGGSMMATASLMVHKLSISLKDLSLAYKVI